MEKVICLSVERFITNKFDWWDQLFITDRSLNVLMFCSRQKCREHRRHRVMLSSSVPDRIFSHLTMCFNLFSFDRKVVFGIKPNFAAPIHHHHLHFFPTFLNFFLLSRCWEDISCSSQFFLWFSLQRESNCTEFFYKGDWSFLLSICMCTNEWVLTTCIVGHHSPIPCMLL